MKATNTMILPLMSSAAKPASVVLGGVGVAVAAAGTTAPEYVESLLLYIVGGMLALGGIVLWRYVDNRQKFEERTDLKLAEHDNAFTRLDGCLSRLAERSREDSEHNRQVLTLVTAIAAKHGLIDITARSEHWSGEHAVAPERAE